MSLFSEYTIKVTSIYRDLWNRSKMTNVVANILSMCILSWAWFMVTRACVFVFIHRFPLNNFTNTNKTNTSEVEKSLRFTIHHFTHECRRSPDSTRLKQFFYYFFLLVGISFFYNLLEDWRMRNWYNIGRVSFYVSCMCSG